MGEPDLNMVLQRLQHLEDRDAIEQLKAAYCAHADAGNPDAERGRKLGALFADDGVWDVGAGRCVGQEAIARGLMSLPEAWSLKLSVHFVMNPRIEIVGDKAIGVWTFLVPAVFKGTLAPQWFAGTYQEKYAREPEGWRFTEMLSVPVLAPESGE